MEYSDTTIYYRLHWYIYKYIQNIYVQNIYVIYKQELIFRSEVTNHDFWLW